MQDEEKMMFRDLAADVAELLRTLSTEGFLYLGRTGVGLTLNFRAQARKVGTLKAVSEAASYHDELSRALLELVAVEGPVWVSYDRITEAWTEEPLRLLAKNIEQR